MPKLALKLRYQKSLPPRRPRPTALPKARGRKLQRISGAIWHERLVEIRQHFQQLGTRGLVERLFETWKAEVQQGYRRELQYLIDELTMLRHRLESVIEAEGSPRPLGVDLVMARAWEPEFIRLWESGASQVAIAQALGIPLGTAKTRAKTLAAQGKIQARPRGGDYPSRQAQARPPGQTRERPPPTVHPGTDDRPPSTADRGPLDIGAAVAAALQPLLIPLITRLEALECRPLGEAPSTVHGKTVHGPPSHPDTSTVHPAPVDPATWELRHLKHSERWTIYVPRAMREELKRRAAAQGQHPSLLVQEALRRYLTEEKPS